MKPVKFAQVKIREEAHGSFATEVIEQAIQKKILNYFFFLRIRQPLHENRILLVNLLLENAHPAKIHYNNRRQYYQKSYSVAY